MSLDAYLSQVCQVGLVADEHDGCVDGATHAVDELLEVACLLEAAPVSDGVRDDEALTRPHVLVPHRRELRLGRAAHRTAQNIHLSLQNTHRTWNNCSLVDNMQRTHMK